MCGICGILQRKPEQTVDREQIFSMMAAIEHRGPDGEGSYFDGPIGLGHKRLAIIDIETGQQPMTNEDGTLWIVFNGEIYNYLELRRDLSRHHPFQTHSDTEVILHLYEELGERCLEKLNGMFSFVIWDSRQRMLFAARDRLGIKPFFWHLDKDRFSFASEPKAFFAAGLAAPEVDLEGLQQYIAFQFCLGERTLFKNIRRLEPGHFLTYRPGRELEPSIVRYWDISHDIDSHHTEEYFADQLLVLLQDAIRLQLRSDVPVGAHLSGGMDSSTVVSLAANLYGNGFHTFTGAFREGPRFDESGYARIVADKVGSIHHEIWPDAKGFMDVIPWLVYIMDEPAAGPGLFPQYYVSKLAREHVKVVLGGQGGDEIFGGYARYLVAYLEQVLKGVIHGTADDGKYVVNWDNISPNLPMLKQYTPMMQSFFKGGLFEDMDSRYFRLVSRIEDAESVFSPDVWQQSNQQAIFSEFQQIFNHPGTKSYFNKMTNFDIKTLLPALLHVEDRTSMSVSLEFRVPLLDHRIVELVTRMPPTIRFKGGDTKRVFREAAKHLLPEKVYNRRDKMGFPVPLNDWLKGPLSDFVRDILLSDRARQRGILSGRRS